MIIFFLSALYMVSMVGIYVILRHTFVTKDLHRQSQIAREFLKAQVEVQNSALQQTADDLQDHIGQLLSIAHTSLNILEGSEQIDENRRYITQANEMISRSILSLRLIDKRIGIDFLKNFKLYENLESDFISLRRKETLVTDFTISGKKYALGYEKEILLYRIAKDVLDYLRCHLRITNITIKLTYNANAVLLEFSHEGTEDFLQPDTLRTEQSGHQFLEIERKAKAIGSHATLRSIPGERMILEIISPLNYP